jgi:hypothetical protein
MPADTTEGFTIELARIAGCGAAVLPPAVDSGASPLPPIVSPQDDVAARVRRATAEFKSSVQPAQMVAAVRRLSNSGTPVAVTLRRQSHELAGRLSNAFSMPSVAAVAGDENAPPPGSQHIAASDSDSCVVLPPMMSPGAFKHVSSRRSGARRALSGLQPSAAELALVR